MTDQHANRIIVERRFPSGSVGRLGTAVRQDDGWRFIPAVSGRKGSRKAWPTWRDCLPSWVGYPNACETRPVFDPVQAPDEEAARVARVRELHEGVLTGVEA